jgi:hypothetical protein
MLAEHFEPQSSKAHIGGYEVVISKEKECYQPTYHFLAVIHKCIRDINRCGFNREELALLAANVLFKISELDLKLKT